MLQNPATGQDNAMSLLSTFLLQGWVMTDEKCRVPDCYVPIMRSKDGSVRFCVSHDTLPTCSPNAKGSAVQQTSRSTNKEADQFADAAARDNEVKENKDDAALLRKRREQSSRASQIIGQKLLQRWTLLNEVCPNPECYAIPLMRDPSKRMVCVNCNRSYITEEEATKADQQTSKQEPERNEVEKAPAERPEDQTHRKKQKTVDDEKKVASKQSQRKASFDVGKAYAQRTGSSSLTLLESIDTKLQDLINQMQAVSDPLRLKHIFEAIEAGARAKKACLEVEKSL